MALITIITRRLGCEINTLTRLNSRMKREGRNILMFLDNAPCHPASLKGMFPNVRIEFLPKHTTSCTQPLEAGIINTWKVHYRRKLLRYVLSQVDGKSTVSSEIVNRWISWWLYGGWLVRGKRLSQKSSAGASWCRRRFRPTFKVPLVTSISGAIALASQLAEFADWQGNEDLSAAVSRMSDVLFDLKLKSLTHAQSALATTSQSSTPHEQ